MCDDCAKDIALTMEVSLAFATPVVENSCNPGVEN